MSDLIVEKPQVLTEGVGTLLKVRYHDNGDGTWSEQVYTGAGGGGGAATIADGSDVTQGAIADSAVAAGAAGTLSAKLRRLTADIGTLLGLRTTSSATVTSVNDSASVQTLLASNAARKGAIFLNNSPQDLYLKLGTAASLTDFTTKIPQDGEWTLPADMAIYTGAITGIWAADASGFVQITEL